MIVRALSNIFVLLVALEHLYILVLEMFLWTKPRALMAFRMSAEKAEATKVLAANQGLYNGFLAAGLFWGLFYPSITVSYQLKLFFLGCVLVAALYGGITAQRRILFIQGLPALAAVIFVVLAG
jgi:putative membrane protein